MRILLSAIACHPLQGSESHVGWSAAKALAAKHDLTVLTHTENIEDIKHAAAADEILRKVQFIGIGQAVTWHPNRMLARLQSWRQYAVWCQEAHEVAAQLVASKEYDLGHHVTYSTWRQVSPLANLGIPWILGPVGGGEKFPAAFRGVLSLQSRLFESAREVSSRLAIRSVKLRTSVRSAAFVLASTPETLKLTRGMGVSPECTALAPAIFIHGDRIKLFKSDRPKDHSPHLRIFAGGNLEGRKGLALALRALARLRDRGVPFAFTFAGYGPELLHLKRLAIKLSLHPPLITFRDSLPLDEYRQALQNSDVYLLPSLRESGGLTLGEAMLAGCVPVVAKTGGPGLLVTPDCGYAFEPDSPEHLVEQMAGALQKLSSNVGHRSHLSNQAVERAEEALSEKRYLDSVENAYRASMKDRA
jgi:glycosyltransferase involved in cell wall biosynthesis